MFVKYFSEKLKINNNNNNNRNIYRGRPHSLESAFHEGPLFS